MPYDVVIDGRTLQLGAVRPRAGAHEGWNFRLLIEDRVVEALPEAEVIDIAQRRSEEP